MDEIEREALNRMGIDWMEFLLIKVEIEKEKEGVFFKWED